LDRTEDFEQIQECLESSGGEPAESASQEDFFREAMLLQRLPGKESYQ
jgi:hypothetical protein